MKQEQHKMLDGYKKNEELFGNKVNKVYSQVLNKVRQKDKKIGLV